MDEMEVVPCNIQAMGDSLDSVDSGKIRHYEICSVVAERLRVRSPTHFVPNSSFASVVPLPVWK
jgi:hypothetical protein